MKFVVVTLIFAPQTKDGAEAQQENGAIHLKSEHVRSTIDPGSALGPAPAAPAVCAPGNEQLDTWIMKRTRPFSRRFFEAKRRTAPGSVPGTLVPSPDAPETRITAIAYNADEFSVETDNLVARAKELIEADCRVWISISGTSDIARIEAVCEQFGVHPLAVEDIVNVHQRPKVDDYGDTALVVARVPSGNDDLAFQQVSFIWGDDFLISICELDESVFEPIRERLRTNRGRVRGAKIDYLLYALLDTVVDHYYPELDRLADQIEEMEERILRAQDPSALKHIHELRVALVAIRRIASSTREMLNTLVRDFDNALEDATKVYFRDCYDHVVQILEISESQRELTNGLLELHLASLNHRTNHITKVLAIVATLFIPLTFLTGVYGMNFDTSSPWNMPELRWAFGYPTLIAAMIVISVAELYVFWRFGWLGVRDQVIQDD